MSLAASVIGLVVLSPFLALIALLVKLDSGGSVLFVQDRVGLGGRPFRLFKFRTMRPAEGPTSEWVKDNERRITRVGGAARSPFGGLPSGSPRLQPSALPTTWGGRGRLVEQAPSVGDVVEAA